MTNKIGEMGISFVYIVSDGLGHYKIGYTLYPTQRLSQIDIGPTRLKRIAIIPLPGAGHNVEKELHEKYKNKKIRGEWFALNDVDLVYLKKLERNWIEVCQSQPFIKFDKRRKAFLEKQLKISKKETTTMRVLNFTIKYKVALDGNSPSFKDIQDGCNLSSRSVVSYHIDKLIEAGLLIKEAGQRQLIVVGGEWNPPQYEQKLIPVVD